MLMRNPARAKRNQLEIDDVFADAEAAIEAYKTKDRQKLSSIMFPYMGEHHTTLTAVLLTIAAEAR